MLENLCEPLRRTSREVLYYLGPGFLTSVAYMDSGNWATNISGGALSAPSSPRRV